MKIIFVGCVQFSHAILEKIFALSHLDIEITGIITKEDSTFNADFVSLSSLAKSKKIPCLIDTGNNQAVMLEWVKERSPDMLLCCGWPYLLGEDIIKCPVNGSIGYHPSLLPHNRGRHPIIWALVLGLKQTGSTFFMMNNEADSGDILNQQVISIEDDDDAATVYQKLIHVGCRQVEELFKDLQYKTLKPVKQDATKANYWRKRRKEDGEIDWRMSDQCIHQLVKALTRPYVGAHFQYHGQEVKVWKTRVMAWHDEYRYYEPGKVISVGGSKWVIKCGQGALQILEHSGNLELVKGEYLIK